MEVDSLTQHPEVVTAKQVEVDELGDLTAGLKDEESREKTQRQQQQQQTNDEPQHQPTGVNLLDSSAPSQSCWPLPSAG